MRRRQLRLAVRGRLVCARDIKKHRKGIKPGGGRILMCLERNRTRLRPLCTAAIP